MAESRIGIALMMKESQKKEEDELTRPTAGVRRMTPIRQYKEEPTRYQHDGDPEEKKKLGGRVAGLITTRPKRPGSLPPNNLVHYH